MKESQFTGGNIYENIKKLSKDLEELGNAMDMVADECGQGSLPHNILKRTYEEKRSELLTAKNTRYEESR